MEQPLTAVYDANILYPAPIRDLFIRLAQAGLVRAKWTETIHEFDSGILGPGGSARVRLTDPPLLRRALALEARSGKGDRSANFSVGQKIRHLSHGQRVDMFLFQGLCSVVANCLQIFAN